MADIKGLERDILQIKERANNMIAYDRQKEYKEGIENIKKKYGSTYTNDALNELINEYKQNKLDETIQELKAFDKKSQELLEQAHQRIERVESEVSTEIDPQTQYELEKHNYILNKLQNELSDTFTGSNPQTNELDEVIQQAKYNKLYANALLQTRNLLIRNVDNNTYLDDSAKGVFKNHVIRKLTEIKNDLLPKEYNELQELKEILGNSEVGARNKLHMFQFMLEMNNERLKTV
ncbi:hypothetical protein FYJ81_12835 [Staphylococcus sp. McC-251-APC-3A2]|uniref:hypothetical protein n=1 Tax=Staphylococcus sp. McC-251-APC-3A2 TaxID=2606623 RepID=UPI0012B218BF|nr:hypothetical protein [Staphylococcus sp. McC-251-APC-3A2]MSU31021.1 hypothetical protein [Staphylococcus sp. McC-251-APC-3A2]